MIPTAAPQFPVLEVLATWREGIEPMGTKRKFWCRTPDDRRLLFKYAREDTGEDWAEKLVAEVAKELGVPCAEVELAACDGQPGVVVTSFLKKQLSLVHGNELLQQLEPEYPREAVYRGSRHTIDRVARALGHPGFHGPAGCEREGLASPLDWFLGYLLLDALVGNTDRHHENWGVVLHAGHEVRYATLAPSYDHASSLGRELRDSKRLALLDGGDHRATVTTYAARTRSALYLKAEDRKPLSPTAAFYEVARAAPVAAEVWIRRLDSFDGARLATLLRRVPGERLSDVAARFVRALVEINRETLLRQREASR